MSDLINHAVEVLNAKLAGRTLDGCVKFEIAGEGAVIIDAAGARTDDGDADATLHAEANVFQSILDGSMDPSSAFMTGKLRLEGDMSMAMRLSSLLN